MHRNSPAIVNIDMTRIDYATSEVFAAALDRAVGVGRPPAIIDLSRVERMGSIGLRALIATAKRSPTFFAVAAPQPLVAEVLRIARLELVFPIFDSLEAARAAAAFP